MANQHSPSRPVALTNATYAAVWKVVETTDALADALRDVQARVELLERWAAVDGSQDAGLTARAEQALAELPGMVAELQRLTAAKLPVLERRVARLAAPGR